MFFFKITVTSIYCFLRELIKAIYLTRVILFRSLFQCNMWIKTLNFTVEKCWSACLILLDKNTFCYQWSVENVACKEQMNKRNTLSWQRGLTVQIECPIGANAAEFRDKCCHKVAGVQCSPAHALLRIVAERHVLQFQISGDYWSHI